MLTQGPALDHKCKLNISSFLTPLHLSDCLICTRNSMFIVLLLQMVGCGCFITSCGRGTGGWILSFSFCFCFLVFFSLVSLSFVLSCPLSFFFK